LPCPIAIETEKADVKRTIRIELIRYTRRVIIARGGDAIAVTNESPAINITPVPQEDTWPAPEGDGHGCVIKDSRLAAGEAVAPQTLRRRRAFRLRDLLRLRRLS
jgi:hypothetical protein